MSVANVGSVINDVIEPELYEYTGSVVFGIWVGFLFCAASLICGLIVN
jgi:hypothetical protein